MRLDALYSFLKNYFGIFAIPFIFMLILDIFFSFIKDKRKKARFKVRLFFSVVFIITIVTVLILGKLFYISKLSEGDIIETSLMTYNLGFFMTYFLTMITNNFKLEYIFISCGVLILISIFFLFGREIRKIFSYFIARRNKKKAQKLKKALLEQMESQTARKEDLEEKKGEYK